MERPCVYVFTIYEKPVKARFYQCGTCLTCDIHWQSLPSSSGSQFPLHLNLRYHTIHIPHKPRRAPATSDNPEPGTKDGGTPYSKCRSMHIKFRIHQSSTAFPASLTSCLRVAPTVSAELTVRGLERERGLMPVCLFNIITWHR